MTGLDRGLAFKSREGVARRLGAAILLLGGAGNLRALRGARGDVEARFPGLCLFRHDRANDPRREPP